MLQAYQDQDLLAAKFFDDNNIEAVTDLMAELKAYHALHDLQGSAIPMLHSFGRMGHTGCPAVLTHWAGSTLRAEQLSPQSHAAAREALSAIHARCVSHGDVRLENMLWKQGRIVFCDFGQSSINATSVKYQHDFQMLDALFH